MIYPESTVQILHSMAAIAVVAALHWAAIKFSERSYALRVLVYGKPELLIRDGKANRRHLKHADLSMDMLRSLLREHDIGDIRQVKYAYLEPDGKLGIVRQGVRGSKR
ncbi:DUF421 domain-containing protein [Candidatus Woesearchaeota archaeon]|nr:DUF421 domain-containing protein [Candidatus Woesearchaeota archaeon]